MPVDVSSWYCVAMWRKIQYCYTLPRPGIPPPSLVPWEPPRKVCWGLWGIEGGGAGMAGLVRLSHSAAGCMPCRGVCGGVARQADGGHGGEAVGTDSMSSGLTPVSSHTPASSAAWIGAGVGAG